MVKKMEGVVFEEAIRFSASKLWQGQKEYYDEKGIDAWTEDVPFYITSNPFIAHSYAKMVLGFIRDWVVREPNSVQNPFYIMELGTGTGQFSFYLLKNLLDLQKRLGLEKIQLRYVMSDVTKSTFNFWENHPALQPYLESGLLDFAVYDLYQNNHIQLHRSGKVIGEGQIENPLIVLANYLFDSVATDVFTVDDGQLYEALATVSTDEDNLDNGQPIDWSKIEIEYTKHPINGLVYQDDFDAILMDYKNHLIDTHFQFPIASLRALEKLKSFSRNKLLLITSDKGYTNYEELDCLAYPELDYHGSFSVMVNYHAIGQYMKHCGGASLIQNYRENIVTGIFSCGFTFDGMVELPCASHEVIHNFSPTDYFLIYEHFIEHYKKCSLEVMASYLNLSAWDPYVFEQVSDYLCELAEEGDPEIVAYLAENMRRIADNFYYFPSSNDVYFDIGIFYQNISRFEEAIGYYEKSKGLFGESDVVSFNIGMCLHGLGRQAEAIAALEDSMRLNGDSKEAKQWIETLQKNES